MDAYGSLPKSYISPPDKSGPVKVFLANQNPAYPVGGSMITNPHNKQEYVVVSIQSELPSKEQRRRAAKVALHEETHSKDKTLNPNEGTGGELNEDEQGTFSWKEFIDKPEYVSPYAQEYGGNINTVSEVPRLSNEELAEETAFTLLPNNDNATAHPDNWRLFTSEANKKHLLVLGSLEKEYPGITAYMATKNGLNDHTGRWYTFGLNDN
jgi:hypothetical protein